VGPTDFVFNVTGVITLYSSGNFQNKLVLQDQKEPFNDFEQQAPILHEAGALGFILVMGGSPLDISGLGSFAWNAKFPDLQLPAVEISIPSFQELLPFIENGTEVTVTFNNTDFNPWAYSFESTWMIGYSIVLGVATLGMLTFAIYKLVFFVRRGLGTENIGTSVLSFEIVANALRFIAVTVDPCQSRKVFPFLLNNILYTIHWPFVIVSTLLITFYWFELIKKTKQLGKVRNFLQKLRIPFWIIFAVLLALDLISSILRGLNYDLFAMIILAGLLYTVVVLLSTIFFLYTGFKLRSILSKDAGAVNDRRKKKLQQTTLHIILSSVGLFMWVVPMILGGLTPLLWVPDNFIVLWFIIFLGTTFSSFFHVLAIHVPGTKESTVSSSALGVRSENSANTKDRT
jgi:hypothetical protein